VNGELAQLVALVAHTRAALYGEPFSLDLGNSTFKYVASLSFDVERRRLFRGVSLESVAETPRDWYDHLARTRCRTAALVIGPPIGKVPGHIASAFAGGGHWGAVVANETGHALWRADWTVGDRKTAVDNKIWRVRYKELPFGPTDPGDSIVEASARLGELLRVADDLAQDGNLDSWCSWFQSALRKLTDDSVAFEYHPDLLPPGGYSQAARRLLSAAERAWVFGGMGSWNDLGFDEPALQERYESLTPKLYSVVLNSIAAAVNHGV
jgi:hypothetical protein